MSAVSLAQSALVHLAAASLDLIAGSVVKADPIAILGVITSALSTELESAVTGSVAEVELELMLRPLLALRRGRILLVHTITVADTILVLTRGDRLCWVGGVALGECHADRNRKRSGSNDCHQRLPHDFVLSGVVGTCPCTIQIATAISSHADHIHEVPMKSLTGRVGETRSRADQPPTASRRIAHSSVRHHQSYGYSYNRWTDDFLFRSHHSTSTALAVWLDEDQQQRVWMCVEAVRAVSGMMVAPTVFADPSSVTSTGRPNDQITCTA